jgi:uncharacterized protein (DUF2249 family)
MEDLVLDVRELHTRGEEPFGVIMAAVGKLAPGQRFVLINTFEPVPLYRVLGRQGFTHVAEELGPNHWRITFSREGEA